YLVFIDTQKSFGLITLLLQPALPSDQGSKNKNNGENDEEQQSYIIGLKDLEQHSTSSDDDDQPKKAVSIDLFLQKRQFLFRFLNVILIKILHHVCILLPCFVPNQRNKTESIEFNTFKIILSHPQYSDHFLLFLVSYRDDQYTAQLELLEHDIRHKRCPSGHNNLVI